MSSEDLLEQAFGRLDDLLGQVREVTAEAHRAIKDLRVLKREVDELLDKEPRKAVQDRIDAEVKRGLDEYRDKLGEAIDAAVAKVGREFEELTELYMSGGKGGKKKGKFDLREELPKIAEREGGTDGAG